MEREIISKAKKIVVKIGTSVLTAKGCSIEPSRIEKIASSVNSLTEKNMDICLVSSGAISAGMTLLSLKERPKSLPRLQAAAAVGQRRLMDLYADAFLRFGRQVAQILLTKEDLKDRRRYLNARNTIGALLKEKVIPIINENDTVTVDEIKFGDNDRLSALVASLIDADLLIMLSDVDGLYGGDKLIKTVDEISSEVEAMASGTDKESCVGGMVTKLDAAKIVRHAGIPCIIANGRRDSILERITDGEDVGTLFLPRRRKLDSRKQWMAFNLKPQGKVYLDKGAVEALLKGGRSLLAAGIVQAEGKFKEADMVSIVDAGTKKEIGRGITNYSRQELDEIKGLKTAEIKKVTGARYYEEVIHRDNLVLM